MRHAHRPDRGAAIRVTGQDDSCDRRPALAHYLQEFGAVHTGHAHVGYDHVDLAALENLQGGLTAVGKLHQPNGTHGPQRTAQAIQDTGLVVNK